MRTLLPASVVLLFIGLSTGCIVDTTVPPDALLSCTAADGDGGDDGGGCPSGRTCVDGRCLTPEQLALPAPAFERAPELKTANEPRDVVSPNPGRDFFTVEFLLNLDLVPGAGAENVTALFGDTALVCDTTAEGPRAWSCAGTVDAATPEGALPIVVTVSDSLGRTVDDTLTIVVDATPPAATIADVVIAGTPLRLAPTAARTGAAVTLVLRLDDDVDPAAVSVLGAPPEAEEYVFDPEASTATLTAVPPALAGGPREVRITAADFAGNELTTSVSAAYAIDVTAPAAPDVDVAGAVVYERAPWGRAIDAASSGPRATVRGAAGSVEAFALVVVSADAAGTQALGVVTADAAGAFIGELAIGDLSSLFVRAVDGAGNESAPVRVRDGVWVVSAARPAGSPASPLSVDVTPRFGRALFDDAQAAVDASVALAASGDGDVLAARTRARWRERTFDAGPPARARAASAADLARDEVVLFGGIDDGGLVAPLDDTWTFDGEQWRERAPSTRPPARHGAAMAYDVAADLTVLFGGTGAGGVLLDDTWLWDGADWTPVAASVALPGPRPRTGARMAADDDGLVLFGGATDPDADDVDAETWRFDARARAWSLVDTADAPPPRADFAMACDVVRAGVVVFGGDGVGGPLDDTWIFVGGAWTELAPSAGDGGALPAAQAGAALFFDAVRGAPVLVGTDAAGVQAELFALGGGASDAQWDVLDTDAFPSARAFAATAALADRGVVVGGVGPGNVLRDDTHVLRAQFTQLSLVTPPALASVSGAYDVPNDRAVVAGLSGGRHAFGFDRLAWTSLAIDGGSGGALTVNSANNIVHVDAGGVVELLTGGGFSVLVAAQGVVFGGSVAAAFDGARVVAAGTSVASLAGTTWIVDATPGIRVDTALSAAGAAPDGDGAVVLFGGNGCAAGLCGDTWLFEANAWTEVTTPTTTAPSPRSGHAMAFDAGRREVVLFGGSDATGADAETWAFVPGASPNTGVWRPVDVDDAPPARFNHALTALGADGAEATGVLLFGGVVGIANARDTWQYDGGGADNAAALVRVRFAAAGVPDAVVEGVDVRALAGGTGHPAGAAVPGVALSAWTRAGWAVVASAAAPAAQPAAIDAIVDVALVGGVDGALFVGDDRTLHLAFTPAAASGVFVDADELALDAFELAVRYRLP